MLLSVDEDDDGAAEDKEEEEAVGVKDASLAEAEAEEVLREAASVEGGVGTEERANESVVGGGGEAKMVVVRRR